MNGNAGFFVMVLIMFLSCKGSETATDSRLAACPVKDVQPGDLYIDWYFENKSVLEGYKGMILPSVYAVYSVDSAQLDSFFTGNGNKLMTVPLPDPVGCQEFVLQESGILPEDLKAKYPDLVSLKGIGKNVGGDLRLDYDGRVMKGQVIMENEVYFITPARKEGEVYYIVYRKADSGEEKQPFETKPTNATQQSEIVSPDR